MPELVDVTLVRGSTYADFRRSYQINVDGEVRGAIRRNGRVAFQVPEGDHVLSLAIDWCGSNRIPFRATTGSNLKFECGSSLAGWRIILILFYIILRPRRYLWLHVAAPAA